MAINVQYNDGNNDDIGTSSDNKDTTITNNDNIGNFDNETLIFHSHISTIIHVLLVQLSDYLIQNVNTYILIKHTLQIFLRVAINFVSYFPRKFNLNGPCITCMLICISEGKKKHRKIIDLSKISTHPFASVNTGRANSNAKFSCDP